MSITIRLWDEQELKAIKQDKWLATVFMNGKTFSSHDIKYYPYNMRRVYECAWWTEDEFTTITIFATDVRMLLRFIDEEYTKRPDTIHQVITQYRPVNC